MPTSRTRRTPWLRSAAAAIALGLTLAGCDLGSQDKAPSEPTSDDTADGTDGSDREPGEHTESDTGGDPPDEQAEQDGGADADGGAASGTERGWDGTGEPPFLEAHEVPQGDGEPYEVRETASGLPEGSHFCTEGLLPAERSWYRHYEKELLGSAHQVNVHAGDPAAAADLMETLTSAAAACGGQQDEERGTTEFRDHDHVAAGDEARGYSMVWTPNDPGGIAGSAIGIARSGSTVTYVFIRGGSDLEDFPAGTFDQPLSTALARLGD